LSCGSAWHNVMEFMFVGNAGRLPQLVPEQVLKLKQLTVLTLAETNKVSFLEVRPFSFQIHLCGRLLYLPDRVIVVTAPWF
jgi:hypothetical protein